MAAKIICITGASSGIGAATAELLAEKGHHLILGARRFERLEEMAPKLLKMGAASVFSHRLDVRDEASVKAFCEAAQSKHGHIDVLLNNAGMVIGNAPVAQGDINEWSTIIDTNVMGVLRLTRLLLPEMIRRKNGQIVMLGSIAGHQVYEGGSAYCASKFALQAITKTLKLELNGTGIRVSTIDPGMVETEFSLVRYKQDKEKAKSVYAGLTPLTGRDIAECIEFVISRPAYVNIDDIIIMPTAQATVYKTYRT